MTVSATDPSTRDAGRGVMLRHLALLDDGDVLQGGLITLLVRTRDKPADPSGGHNIPNHHLAAELVSL